MMGNYCKNSLPIEAGWEEEKKWSIGGWGKGRPCCHKGLKRKLWSVILGCLTSHAPRALGGGIWFPSTAHRDAEGHMPSNEAQGPLWQKGQVRA